LMIKGVGGDGDGVWGARKASMKSFSCVGDEGMTIIVGMSFSARSDRVRSRGAGMRV
jgi:hypothetical protein